MGLFRVEGVKMLFKAQYCENGTPIDIQFGQEVERYGSVSNTLNVDVLDSQREKIGTLIGSVNQVNGELCFNGLPMYKYKGKKRFITQFGFHLEDLV